MQPLKDMQTSLSSFYTVIQLLWLEEMCIFVFYLLCHLQQELCRCSCNNPIMYCTKLWCHGKIMKLRKYMMIRVSVIVQMTSIFCAGSERVCQRRHSDEERAGSVWAPAEATDILSGTPHCRCWKIIYEALLYFVYKGVIVNSTIMTYASNHPSTVRLPSLVHLIHHCGSCVPSLSSSCTTITRGSRQKQETICTVPGAPWTAANSTACSSTSNSPTPASSSVMW